MTPRVGDGTPLTGLDADVIPSTGPVQRLARRRFLRNRSALVGGGLCCAMALFALFGPALSGHDPLASDFVHGLDPVTSLPVPPSARFWLGTDRLFRDELSRLAVGARLSLVIGVAATAIATGIGTLVGVVAGWFEGERGLRVPAAALMALPLALTAAVFERGTLAWALLAGALTISAFATWRPTSMLARGPLIDVDAVLMRTVDIGLSFPFLLLVMAIGAAVDRTSATTILLVLGLTGWLGIARIVRAKTMQVRRFEFIDAARALGHGTPRILVSHILPNVLGPVVVIATAQVAQMILAESVLSYLGAGVTPPTPTWGGMLAEGQDYFGVTPWLVLCPATAILLTVLGFNLMGEGLRDALDPYESP